MNKSYYIYILTNKYNRVLYTGVTNDLVRRVHEHRYSKKGFTGKYNVSKLVYFEEFTSPEQAIQGEKQIKAGSREKKIELIEEMNPEWEDLYEDVVGWHE
ncbi:GIY-YIG nuclease family protein [Rhodohalobacter sp. 614A]|uniref:GIY-YIG nuclease family protein n=1 Tax=Rhodohalobacter sp. 614A TaxID=2908649 RepID=UPI001F3C1B71|nr:GIY-YIG nuclease family protein [Rhodohalobacter sp. 614A]